MACAELLKSTSYGTIPCTTQKPANAVFEQYVPALRIHRLVMAAVRQQLHRNGSVLAIHLPSQELSVEKKIPVRSLIKSGSGKHMWHVSPKRCKDLELESVY